MVTTVAMAHPVINQDRLIKFRCRDRSRLFFCLKAGLALACLPLVAQSADWDGTARLALSEVYSDNIRLSVGDEERDSITTITPGFSVNGQGARLKLSADYAMQNIFYAQNPSSNSISNQLNANEQAELIKDLFYFDSSASISQQLMGPSNQLALDNLNIGGNRRDVRTLQVEPYLRRNLGSYVSAELRYLRGWVDYDDSGVSGAESSVVSGYLVNGPGVTQLSWRLGYRQQKDMRDTGVDSERRSSDGMIRYRVLSTFSVVGYAGREENNIQTSQPFANGAYWSAGFNWTPSPKFSLEGTTGKNYDQGQLTWTPISRTSVNITYSDRNVGLVTGASWSGLISHRTRRSTWAFDYSEAVTNVQLLALKEQRPVGFVVDPVTGMPAIVFLNVYDLTDEEFLRARAKGSVSYRTSKSTIALEKYNELRTYELSGSELASDGGNISWQWRFAARTSSMISVQQQRFEVLNSPGERQSLTTSFSLSRTLGSSANARVELRRQEVDAINSGQKYVENRISAYLNMSF